MNAPARRSAIVTGSAGGLGSWICRKLAEQGWDVCPGWHGSDQSIAPLAAELAALQATVHPLRLDMLDPDSLAAAVDFEPPSPVEALIINAAKRPQVAPFGRIGHAELSAQFQVSAVGPYELIRMVWRRHFQRQRKGHLIVISSVAVEEPVTPRMAGYVVGKAALEALATCASAEYGPAGLATTILRLDHIDTPMLHVFESRFIDVLREKGRIRSPDHVASMVVTAAMNPPVGGASLVRKI